MLDKFKRRSYRLEYIDTGDYTPEEYRVNVQLDYNITKKISFFAAANNILNKDRKTQFLDAAYITPDYASTRRVQTFGVTITAGINAKF